jgi:hypothetical protein
MTCVVLEGPWGNGGLPRDAVDSKEENEDADDVLLIDMTFGLCLLFPPRTLSRNMYCSFFDFAMANRCGSKGTAESESSSIDFLKGIRRSPVLFARKVAPGVAIISRSRS